MPPCPKPKTTISPALYPHVSIRSSSISPFSNAVLNLNPASASSPPLPESKMMSSPQWKPSRSSRFAGPWTEMQAVSGRFSWEPSLVKESSEKRVR
ncbi:hypothetical protein Tdes44962_MAKER04763 [Teratosphaeria destructans]|uniref:Uncharacterized protein n=1 Tax=Teratosphaeria destructans TaxID=418781 RepID=A0A9W7SLM1_9PEZI|nr:hypothetical protein Tdes44962_MAKER04763 [Teratosphaeria destructans]